jgi:hypothetical protein
MSKVFKSSYPGWNNYPVYQCSKTDDWFEVSSWLRKNDCDHNLLSSGGHGYIFQIRKNYDWFLLRWS